jgi:hypothetical protein
MKEIQNREMWDREIEKEMPMAGLAAHNAVHAISMPKDVNGQEGK